MEVQNTNLIGAGAVGLAVGGGTGLAVGASKASKFLETKGIKKGTTQDAFVKSKEDAAVDGIRKELTEKRTKDITAELTSKAKDTVAAAETSGAYSSGTKFADAMKKVEDSTTAAYKKQCAAAKTPVDDKVLAQKVADAQSNAINTIVKNNAIEEAGAQAEKSFLAAHPVPDIKNGAKAADVMQHKKDLAAAVQQAKDTAKTGYVDQAFDVKAITKNIADAKPDETALKNSLTMTRDQKDAFSAKVNEAVKKVGEKAKETFAEATSKAKSTKIKWAAALAVAGTAIGVGAAALINKNKKAEAPEAQN